MVSTEWILPLRMPRNSALSFLCARGLANILLQSLWYCPWDGKTAHHIFQRLRRLLPISLIQILGTPRMSRNRIHWTTWRPNWTTLRPQTGTDCLPSYHGKAVQPRRLLQLRSLGTHHSHFRRPPCNILMSMLTTLSRRLNDLSYGGPGGHSSMLSTFSFGLWTDSTIPHEGSRFRCPSRRSRRPRRWSGACAFHG